MCKTRCLIVSAFCLLAAPLFAAWPVLKTYEGESLRRVKMPMDVEYYGPNPQMEFLYLAAGCLVDQLLGDYASRHVGLGGVAE